MDACACMLNQSCLTLCDPMNCSLQPPLSMEFSGQEYWSGLPFPTSGDLPDPEVEPCLLHLVHWQADFSLSLCHMQNTKFQGLVSFGAPNHFMKLTKLLLPHNFPGGSVVKNPFVNAGGGGLIPGSGRSPGKGNGNPLQYSCM